MWRENVGPQLECCVETTPYDRRPHLTSTLQLLLLHALQRPWHPLLVSVSCPCMQVRCPAPGHHSIFSQRFLFLTIWDCVCFIKFASSVGDLGNFQKITVNWSCVVVDHINGWGKKGLTRQSSFRRKHSHYVLQLLFFTGPNWVRSGFWSPLPAPQAWCLVIWLSKHHPLPSAAETPWWCFTWVPLLPSLSLWILLA